MRSFLKTQPLFVLLIASIFTMSCHDDNSMSSSNGDFLAITSGGVTLAAELVLPAGDGPHPALIIVHGSGKITRQQYANAARLYASLGVATLTYDKRGVGQSNGRYRDVSAGNSIEVFDVLADDVVAAAEFLKNHPQIDPNQIGLLGPSQAGWIIPLAASRSDDVKFMICISGAASTVGISDFYDSIAEQSLTDEQIAEALRNFNGTHGFDPVPYLGMLTIPGLWVYGDEDKSNPTTNDMEILERLKAEKNKDYTIHLFPHADHDFNDVRTGQPINAITDCVGPWLLSHVDVSQ